MTVAGAEAAIVAWVRAATGLAASNVLWALQNAARPAGPWISLRLIGDKPVGLAAVRQAFDAGADAGEEITRTVEQLTTWTLSIQAFGGDATGAAAPRNLLSLIRAHARLPARALTLRTAGVGVLSFTPITSLDGGLSEASVEPRAAMTVALCVPVEVAETLGYIGIVEVTDEDRGHMITITEDD